MTHFIGMVVADDEEELAAVLARFDENSETPPRFEPLDDATIVNMAGHYKFEMGDAAAIKRHCEDWNGGKYATVDGKHGYLRTYNPDSKWDWYVIGGRWADQLPASAMVEELPAIFEKVGYTPKVIVDWAGWHSAENVGWFATSSPSGQPETIVADRLATHAGRKVYFVDFHI